MKYFILLSSLFALSTVVPASLSDSECVLRTRPCPGVEPKASLVAVFITDCVEEPCIFKIGQNVTIEMDLELRHNVTTMSAEIRALAIGGPDGFPWPGFNTEVCENILSQNDCPLVEGEYFTYGISTFIETAFPPIRTDVKYIIRDQNDDILMCWITKAQLQRT